MIDHASSPFFALLKSLGYVALAAMGAAVVYAATMAVRYWPGISV
jgi:hypothetical protein